MKNRIQTGSTEWNNTQRLGEGELTFDETKKALRVHGQGRLGGLELVGVRVVTTGPGPQEPMLGDSNTSFYGEVDQSLFFTPNQIASELGLSAGISINQDSPWLKFNHQGKILFIAKKPYRYAIAWANLYNCGAVYGDDTTGNNPLGSGTLQNAIVSFGGQTYRVRLLTGADNDPVGMSSNLVSDSGLAENSEWNRLIVRLIEGDWSQYSASELGAGNVNGGSTICQETPSVNLNGTRINRGYNGIRMINSNDVSQTHSAIGWRPVLELVE